MALISQMTEQQLIIDIDAMSKDAAAYNSELMRDNNDALERYLQKPYGDEEDERSSVITNEVEDTVESDMVSLSRVFLGSKDIIKFLPRDSSDQSDVSEAKQKQAFADYIIRGRKDSYRLLTSALKSMEINTHAVVKYWTEEVTKKETQIWSGIDELELARVIQTFDADDVDEVKILSKSDEFDGESEIDVEIEITRTSSEITITSIPVENFVITRDAESKDTAQVVGDDALMTRGDLVSLGFGKKEIDEIPRTGPDGQIDPGGNKDTRNSTTGGDHVPWDDPTWASEQIVVKTRFVKIDYDGDGIAERRYIMYGQGAKKPLINEPFEHVPYAIGSAILMPYRVIGRSRAQQAMPFQRQNTSITRGLMDNIYAVNMPRMGYNEDVEEDDLYEMEHGGGIRVNGRGNPGQSILPIQIPYIGDKALQVLQYQSSRKAQTTGTLMSSQGLRSDEFNDESATRFDGVREEGKGKIELVARNIAETFFRELYEGVIWMASHYQNTGLEIEVLGDRLQINPSDWKYDHDINVKVGLGSGDDEKSAETLSALLSMQLGLKEKGSPIVDDVKIYNTIDGLIKALGLSDTRSFANNPERPDEVVTAQNEQLVMMVNQLSAQLQEMQNPLAEAELIRAQAKMAEVQQKESIRLAEIQGKQQLEMAKFFEDQRQFNEKMAADNQKQFQDLTIKITELELQNKTNLPGGLDAQ